MNAVLRSIVKMGNYLGCSVYFIHEGYQGLIKDDAKFELATSSSVFDISGIGGTIIGSARCEEFKEKSGRLKAARNLVKHKINNLICIGGDGTLSGGYTLKNEWLSLLTTLVDQGEISLNEQTENYYLNIVGIVATIANDFCGTDMTIGSDTALHRIVEAVDCIQTTALSHQRCFILEVMGKNCGYLALSAGLATEADWIFIPELPPKKNWENDLCRCISDQRKAGHRLNIIIVSEGAIDFNGNQINPEYIKDIITQKLNIDTRITKLGYVQRGGHTSAFDRVIGLKIGAEAVVSLMTSSYKSDPVVMALIGNQTCCIPLVESVEKTQKVKQMFDEKDFEKVIELRNPSTNLELNNSSLYYKRCNFAVMSLGAPACGVNSAIRSFVRHSYTEDNVRVLAVEDGFEGLKQGLVKELDWKSVYGWTSIGGSLLGCQRVDAAKVGYEIIAERFKEFNIKGLLLIGGFDAFNSAIQLSDQRIKYEEFKIPIVCIPATISNNIPGSDISIGSDTALNEIVSICDKIKQSAYGYNKRCFLVETMGGYCGYLATAASLASEADYSYIFEEKFTIDDLTSDLRRLKAKFRSEKMNLRRGLIIRNEKANQNFSSEFFLNLMKEEGADIFSSRLNVLGHVQQGYLPTSLDRLLGVHLGARSIAYMVDTLKKSIESEKSILEGPASAVVIGIRSNKIVFTPVNDLKEKADFKHRIPINQWWIKLRDLSQIINE